MYMGYLKMTKSKPQIKIVDAETGEEVIRDANADELAQMEIDTANAQAKKAEVLAKETQRQAILDRLGLTADELQTILG
jgi:hypothetical protein